MSILTEVLSDYITVDRIAYPIRTDFRVWLEFDRIISDRKIAPEKKAVMLMRLCFDMESCPHLPPIGDELLSCLYDFYMCKKPQKDRKKAAGYVNVFSFEEDAQYVYAAFLAQYKIDLLSVPYMHWHKFMALFRGLDENCRLMKIISWRSVDLSEIHDEKKREYYRRMKELYALPDTRSKAEIEYDAADAISGVM